MTLLITPREVLELAFPASPSMSEDTITEAVIVAAQQKFIRPVLGAWMYEHALQGRREQLMNDYLKPALALYVKLLLIPTLSSSMGDLGVVQYKSGVFAPASEKSLAALKKRTKSDADALMRRAVEHIEANPSMYTDYDPADNVLNRTSLTGGVALPKR